MRRVTVILAVATLLIVAVLTAVNLFTPTVTQPGMGPVGYDRTDPTQIVTYPQDAIGNMSPFEVQVTYRLEAARHSDGMNPRYIPKWQTLLKDKDANVYGRICAARFLLDTGEHGSAEQFLQSQLDSSDIRRVYNTGAALVHYVQCGGKSCWAVGKMIALLDDSRLIRRVNGDDNLGGKWDDFPEGDFEDPTYSPLDGICACLGALKAGDALPGLIHLLPQEFHSSSAIDALGDIGDPSAIPALIDVLKSDKAHADRAIWALAKFKYAPAVPLIVDRLRQTRHQDYEAAQIIDALGDIGDSRAIPAIREAAAGSGHDVASAARRNLVRLENKDPLPALLELLATEQDRMARIDIARDIGKLHDDRAIKQLSELVRHSSDACLRWNAINALGGIGSKASLSCLVDLFSADYTGLDHSTGWKMPIEKRDFWEGSISGALEDATGQAYGTDANAWRKYLETHRR